MDRLWFESVLSISARVQINREKSEREKASVPHFLDNGDAIWWLEIANSEPASRCSRSIYLFIDLFLGTGSRRKWRRQQNGGCIIKPFLLLPPPNLPSNQIHFESITISFFFLNEISWDSPEWGPSFNLNVAITSPSLSRFISIQLQIG